MRQQTARKFVVIDTAIAVQGSVTPDQTVEIAVVEIANYDLKRIAMDRMNERTDLPATQVSREE